MGHDNTEVRGHEDSPAPSIFGLRQTITAVLFVIGLGAIFDMDEPTIFLVVWVVLYALVAGKPAARADRGPGLGQGAVLGIAVAGIAVVLAVYAGARALFTTMEVGMPSTWSGVVAAAALALASGVTALVRGAGSKK